MRRDVRSVLSLGSQPKSSLLGLVWFGLVFLEVYIRNAFKYILMNNMFSIRRVAVLLFIFLYLFQKRAEERKRNVAPDCDRWKRVAAFFAVIQSSILAEDRLFFSGAPGEH